MNTFVSQPDAVSPDPLPELDWQAFRYLTGELSAADVAAFERLLETDLTACEALARCVELTATVHAACDVAVSQPSLVDFRPNEAVPQTEASRTEVARTTAVAVKTSFRRELPAERVSGRVSTSQRVSWQARVAACAVALLLVVSLGWLSSSSQSEQWLARGELPAVRGAGAIFDAQGQDIGQVVSLWRQSSQLTQVESALAAGQPAAVVMADELVDEDDDLEEGAGEQVVVSGAHVRVPSWLLAAVSRETRGVKTPKVRID